MIRPTKKKKGVEEVEEVMDSMMTNNKMDIDTGPSNAGSANSCLVAPPAIEAPSTLESSGNSSKGSS
jgi:hypothetical protein